ncbi:hypothetical protein F5887DRAFT_1078965 [Amanita rubescens]|nr:hypothetical protein F5887DRAFT_1078965 [Amanita rubescens]
MYVVQRRGNVEILDPQVQGIQPLPQRDFTAILDAFDASGCSIPDLVIALLTERRFKSSAYTAELLQQSGDVLRSLLRHAKLPRNAEKAACEALHRVYVREIKDLVKPSAGWNFSAQRATPEDIDDFDLEDLASDVADTAPRLWALLDILLLAKNKQLANSDGNVARASPGDGETDDDDDAALQGTVRTPPTSPEQKNEKKSNRRLALRKIKKTVIISIFMQSTSQKANPFQSVFGIFLHACRAPEKVIETLAHMGISISMTAIYDAIKSLSINARRALQDLGRTMSFAIAYDNVDVLLKTSVPTVEKTELI